MLGGDASEVPGGDRDPGKELLERGYIDEEDYMGLRVEIKTRGGGLLEMDFPAKYRVEVYFRG